MIAAVGGGVGGSYSSIKRGNYDKKNESLKNTGLFLAFAGPAVFAFMAVVIIPFLYGFYLTFTSWDGFPSQSRL